MIDKAMVLL